MDIKVFVLIFIILVKCQSIYSQDIFCMYAETVRGYTCEFFIYNPDGFDNTTIINGQHLVGKSDGDVQSVVSYGGLSTNIPRIFCDRFLNLETIKFSSLNIERIGINSFWNCLNLVTLDLQMNQIASINQLAFVRAVNLTSIYLQHNKITNSSNNVFFGLGNLTLLNLGDNQLSTLNSNWFSTLSNLRYLYVENNQVEFLPDGTFANLNNLVHINLDNNNLKVIRADSFGNLPTLSIASFQNNQIDGIDERFVDNTGVISFDLKGNLCADVNIVDTTQFRQVMRSQLTQCFRNYEDMNGDHNNTLFCSYIQTEYGYTCRASIYNPSGFNNFTTIRGVHQLGYDDSKVQAIIGMNTITPNIPKIFCDRFLNVVTIFYVQLSIRNIGPDSFWNCRKLLDLNIWVNQIQDLHEVTFILSPQIRRLDMRQNRISDIPRIFFFPLSEMKSLNLEQNDLTNLHPDWFGRQWQLTFLNLQYNKIEELPRAVFSNMTVLEQLNLNNNRLKVIHSNSFGSHSMLTNASFVNNQINAIDERFIDNTGLTNIDMRGNICANLNIIDNSPSRDFIKAALRDCFQNYEDLYGETTTTTTTSTTTTLDPQCPAGYLDERVCMLEFENKALRSRIEALENRKDEL